MDLKVSSQKERKLSVSVLILKLLLKEKLHHLHRLRKTLPQLFVRFYSLLRCKEIDSFLYWPPQVRVTWGARQSEAQV